MKEGHSGEKVVLGSAQAVGKAQAVIFEEVPLISTLPDAYEVYGSGLQPVAVEIFPARILFGVVI